VLGNFRFFVWYCVISVVFGWVGSVVEGTHIDKVHTVCECTNGGKWD
jgi:hypothetical protein